MTQKLKIPLKCELMKSHNIINPVFHKYPPYLVSCQIILFQHFKFVLFAYYFFTYSFILRLVWPTFSHSFFSSSHFCLHTLVFFLLNPKCILWKHWIITAPQKHKHYEHSSAKDLKQKFLTCVTLCDMNDI